MSRDGGTKMMREDLPLPHHHPLLHRAEEKTESEHRSTTSHMDMESTRGTQGNHDKMELQTVEEVPKIEHHRPISISIPPKTKMRASSTSNAL